MVYILSVIGFARRPRGLAAVAAVVGTATLLGGGLGCGSNDNASTTGTTSADAATPAGTAPPADSPSAAQPAKGAMKSRRQNDHPGPGAVGRADRGAKIVTPGKRRAAYHRALQSCPTGLPRAQCSSLVKGAAQAKGADSYVVEQPSDCLEAMSKAECEATLTAQQDAAQESSSIDVQECLQTRTARCKEVLGPILEEQYAASQEAGG